MAAYIALFFSLVSLILMIVILIRFKKLFSTDAIIEKTKAQMNRVIMDVNNNANRDLELINESSRRLRALLNEADKKMENFREATQLLRNTIAEAEKLNTGKVRRAEFVENERFSDIKPVGQKTKKKSTIDPDASFKVNNGAAFQGSLFDDEDENSILKDETVVTKDGAAYKEVPLINTKVYDERPETSFSSSGSSAASAMSANSENQNKNPDFSYPPKNPVFYTAQTQNKDPSLKDKVEKLFNQGMQVDAIADELSCPVSEVQFIIDML